MNRLYDAIAWLVTSLVWDVLDRGGKWARVTDLEGDE